MSQMVYYYLRKGDYLQSGDEYEAKEGWKPIDPGWIGAKWGFDPRNGKPFNWARVRRLVPEALKAKPYPSFQEQWGEEFEMTGSISDRYFSRKS